MSERATGNRRASSTPTSSPISAPRSHADASTRDASDQRAVVAFTFAVPKSALADALARVSGLPKQSRLLPILQSVLIETAAWTERTDAVPVMRLHTTDLERWVTTEVPTVALRGAGKIALPLEHLARIVAALPAGIITIDVSGTTAKLTAGRARVQINGLPVDEWPAHAAETASAATATRTHVVDGRAFTSAIARVAPHAAGDKETRAQLKGALVESSDDGLALVTCDGPSIMRVIVAPPEGEPLDLILPKETFPLIARLFAADESLRLELGEQLCRLVGEHSTLITRTIDGQYPAYRMILALTPTLTVVANRAELIAAVERCALTAEYDRVVLRFGERGIVVSGYSADVGETEDHVDATRTIYEPGAVRRIAVIGDRLKSLLKSVTGTDVALDLSGEIEPVYLREAPAAVKPEQVEKVEKAEAPPTSDTPAPALVSPPTLRGISVAVLLPLRFDSPNTKPMRERPAAAPDDAIDAALSGDTEE